MVSVFLDTLSKVTGAHFFAVGCWDDRKNNTMVSWYVLSVLYVVCA